MAGAYRAANLDDFTYSRWLTFKENEGILSFEEGRIPPEKLADLDDDSFQNAVSMIPVLKSSNYIVPIASNPNLYRNAQKLIKAGALNDCCEMVQLMMKMVLTCSLLKNYLIMNMLKCWLI